MWVVRSVYMHVCTLGCVIWRFKDKDNVKRQKYPWTRTLSSQSHFFSFHLASSSLWINFLFFQPFTSSPLLSSPPASSILSTPPCCCSPLLHPLFKLFFHGSKQHFRPEWLNKSIASGNNATTAAATLQFVRFRRTHNRCNSQLIKLKANYSDNLWQ